MTLIAVVGTSLMIALPVTLAGLAWRADQREKSEPVTPDWQPEELVEIREESNRDPLNDYIPDFDLAAPTWFEDMRSRHAIQLDWEPASFTQEWSRIDLDRALGDTQSIEVVQP